MDAVKCSGESNILVLDDNENANYEIKLRITNNSYRIW